MPGIVGFIRTSEARCPSPAIDTMLATMLHEPSYTTGTLTVESLGVFAAWACHGRSYCDCLPIWNETRDICLVFVGENFFDTAAVIDLRARGHQFDADTASCLVHLYEETGDRFFSKLNGVFSGLLIDLRLKKVVLFNDRYGLGRVYYHQTNDGFYFASEAKALLKAVPQLRVLDMRSLAEYFACSSVLQNRTLFNEIAILPPGSLWTFNGARQPERKAYFDRTDWEVQLSLSEADYYPKLKDTLERVLPRYFGNAEDIAMSLTGGLDSRIIMAFRNEHSSRLLCYSHQGMFNECADARLARLVANVCGQPHQVVQVGKEFFAEFPSLAMRTAYITDGLMDVNVSAGLYANRIARNMARVRMTGNYGGEILRSIVMLRPAKLKSPFFSADFKPLIATGIETLAAEKRVRPTSFIAFKQVPWHHYSRFALENSQWTVRSPYLDNDVVSLAYESPTDARTNLQFAERLIADGNPALAAFPTDRGPLGRHGFFGRLAELYQEFTFKADYAYDYGMPQWLTKVDRVLAPLHLERLFLGRHKYYHFRYWYRHQLAPFVRDVLLDSRTLARPYLDRARVGGMVEAHVSGRGNYTSEISSLLTVELMQRQLVEQV